MKFKFTVLSIIGLTLTCSCTEVLNTDAPQEIIQEDYTIPIEDALTSLEKFMIDEGKVTTKGGINDYVENYFPVSAPSTKSSIDTVNVLYAVNFKDNGGYALLAADSRIQEDMLAVTDSGCVSGSNFEDPVLSMEPTSNDDLSESEYYKMMEAGYVARPKANAEADRACLLYAKEQVEKRVYKSTTYQWKTVKEVPIMLKTLWTQSTKFNDIFNKYCPEVGWIWRTKAPAGCVCIALAQIIAYHEFPSMSVNGWRIDYTEMKKTYPNGDNRLETSNLGTEEGREMLAHFCRYIGAECNTLYFSVFGTSYGFALPTDAQKCLERLCYDNVTLDWGYDEEKVLKSLDNGCPVFISAVSGCIDGHAWVIDGYKKRNCVQTSNGMVTKSQTLVHCNWGWHGISNGYYTSGIFNTAQADSYDLYQGDDYNFQYALNTITYDKPNR